MNNLVLKKTVCTHVLLGVLAVNLFCVTQVSAIPPRPEAIEFEKLEFTPPQAADFRRMLSDGTVVYVAESHEFPLIKLSVTFKGGDSLDP